MIYFTGDTHHNIDTQKIVSFNPITKKNSLIVLGDWGGVWYRDLKKNYKLLRKWCKWQKEKNFKLFVILGNHENYDMLKRLPVVEIKDERNYIKAKKLKVINPFTKGFKCDIFILENGFQIIDNKKLFVIRGASSIDKEYRKEGVDWWRDEVLSEEEKKEIIAFLEKNDISLDYVISHTAPSFLVEKLIEKFDVNPKKIDEVSDFLDEIYNKYLKGKFKYWLFGHFHLDCEIDNFICLYQRVLSEEEIEKLF